MSSNGLFFNSSVFLAGPGRRERFALVDTASLEDKNLSWKAKGMWAILLSRTDNWQTRVSWLTSLGPDGDKSVRSGLKELEDKGYLLSRRPQAADGTFLAYEYLVLGAPAPVLFEDDFVERWQSFSESPSQERVGIIRTPPHLQRRFAQIDAGGLLDPDIDFRSKGIWCYLMSRPETWTVQMKELSSASRDGRESTMAGINQLLSVEYILRKSGRGDDGRFEKSMYWFFEKRFSEIKKTYEFLSNELADFEPQAPLPQNPSTVKHAPLPQNPSAVKHAPLPQNPSTVKHTPLPQNPSTVIENEKTVANQGLHPQAGFRQVDKRQVVSANILSIKETYKEDYLGGQLISREPIEEPKLPTDQPTNQSIEEFLEDVFLYPTEQFVDACSDYFKIGWSAHISGAFTELFSNYDSKAARLWLVYEKFERLAGKFSAYGIYDMLKNDLDAGKCPRPSLPPRVYEDVHSQTETRLEVELPTPAVRPLAVTPEAVQVWSSVKESLANKVSAHNFQTWFQPLAAGGVDATGNFYLIARDAFFQAWVEDNYLELISGEIRKYISGANVVVTTC